MIRVDFGAKPWIYPMPVLIIGTYDEMIGTNIKDSLAKIYKD